jgi:hypothetical protein
VSPSDQGKTDTVKIFVTSKEHTGTWIITPCTESRLIEEFEDRSNVVMVVIDEPDDWTDKRDYKNAAMMCKHLMTGEIRAPRSNYFTTSVSLEKETKTAISLMCNKKQFDYVRTTIARTGLLDRSIVVRTHQNALDTTDYVRRHYEKAGGVDKIRFNPGYDFITRNITREEQEYADRNFIGTPRETVIAIARITPEETFCDLMPYLLSGKMSRYVEEQIEFKEV